ncbi:unnamed protein product [Phytophthora lilii]|uniref:Unnamed protein product n=1 Tax=Phytophthora lilii TaxID=2077276 RepID=A0A9W7CG32_9STRA|nr:unnamed protein product [Phytophthora lilii]
MTSNSLRFLTPNQQVNSRTKTLKTTLHHHHDHHARQEGRSHLGSNNYFHWEFAMRMTLTRKGQLAHVQVVKAPGEITEAWLLNDMKALGLFAQGLLLLLGLVPLDHENLAVIRHDKGFHELQQVQGRKGLKGRKGSKGYAPRKNGAFKGKCFKCGQIGHMKRDCPDPNAGNDDDAVFAVGNSRSAGWQIDSGATAHMTPHRNDLFEYKHLDSNIEVTIADSKKIRVVGMGSVRLTGIDGMRITMVDVLYSPGLDRQLLSVSRLAERGMSVEFQQKSCTIWNNSKAIALGKKVGKAYVLDCEKDMAQYVEYAGVDTEWELWHARMDHLNMDALAKTQRATTGMPIMNKNSMALCGGCMKGKQMVARFPSRSISKTTKVLQLVHTDVMGPMKKKSKGGTRYVLRFVDDYSRFVVAFFITKKSEVPAKFKMLMNLYENQWGEKIKCLRSDNGTEFINKEMDKLCALKGILHQSALQSAAERRGGAHEPHDHGEGADHAVLQRHLDNVVGRGGQYVSVSDQPVHDQHALEHDTVRVGVQGQAEAGPLARVRFGRSTEDVDDVVLHEQEKQHTAKAPTESVAEDHEENTEMPEAESSELTRDELATYRRTPLAALSDNRVFHPEPERVRRQLEPVLSLRDAAEEYKVNDMDDPDNDDHFWPPSRKRPRVDEENLIVEAVLAYAANVGEADDAPTTYQQAMKSNESSEWAKAMNAELKAHADNGSWTLVQTDVEFPAYWVPMAKGFKQKYGVDVFETYSPVANMNSIRVVLSVVVVKAYVTEQLDVDTAFLNSKLKEQVFMEVPYGVPNADNMMCKFNKAIYGLKQATSAWYQTIHAVIMQIGFRGCGADQCVYVKEMKDNYVYVCLYVDDMIIAAKTNQEINEIKLALKNAFKMKELGAAKFILGIEINHDPTVGTLMIKQTRYIEDVVNRFNQQDAKAVMNPCESGMKLTKLQSPTTNAEREDMRTKPYRALIGCLLYIATCTRPDVAYIVTQLSRFLENPGQQHWKAAIRVLRYLKTTTDFGIVYYSNNGKVMLEAYTNAYWAATWTTVARCLGS